MRRLRGCRSPRVVLQLAHITLACRGRICIIGSPNDLARSRPLTSRRLERRPGHFAVERVAAALLHQFWTFLAAVTSLAVHVTSARRRANAALHVALGPRAPLGYDTVLHCKERAHMVSASGLTQHK